MYCRCSYIDLISIQVSGERILVSLSDFTAHINSFLVHIFGKVFVKY